MKQKLTGANYGTKDRIVQLKIDEIFAEKIIPADDSVRLLAQILEEMDLSPLMRAYERLGRRPVTDPDATLMHMREDYMRNAQLKPGYNIRFGVEGEYITGVSVSSERSDQLTVYRETLRGFVGWRKPATIFDLPVLSTVIIPEHEMKQGF